MVKQRIAVALGYFVISSAHGVTGSTLLDACLSSDKVERARCEAYAIAIVDVMKGQGQLNGQRACFPNNVPRNRIGDVVRQWLQSNASERQTVAASGIPKAFAQAFPCK